MIEVDDKVRVGYPQTFSHHHDFAIRHGHPDAAYPGDIYVKDLGVKPGITGYVIAEGPNSSTKQMLCIVYSPDIDIKFIIAKDCLEKVLPADAPLPCLACLNPRAEGVLNKRVNCGCNRLEAYFKRERHYNDE